MSDSNRVQLSYVKEATWDTTPAVPLIDLRMTGEDFGHGLDHRESNELRSDRQVPDSVKVGGEAAGGFNFELSYEAPPDELLEGALFSSWVGVAGGSTTVLTSGATGSNLDFSLNLTTGTITFGSAVTHGIIVGQSFTLAGSASDDGTLVATVVAGQVVTVANIIATEVLDETDAATITPHTLSIFTSGATASNLDFSLNLGANTITFGSAVNHALIVGQWFELTGSTADDGYHLVTVVSGQVVTVESLITTEVLDETDLATVKGTRLRNGTTMSSFTFQRHLADKTKFFRFGGQVCNSLSLSVTAEEMITGRMDFMGGTIAATDFAATTFGTGANTIAPSNDVINAAVNVGAIREAGSAIDADLYIQECSVNIANNVRGKKGIGVVGNVGLGVGKCRITGTLNVLFEDGALYTKYLAGTETSLSFKLEDGSGNAYIFSFPRVQITEDDGGKTEGSDTEVVENISWQALRDIINNYMMQICKFAA